MKISAKEINGYPGYFITNDGRVFHEVKTYMQQRSLWWKQLNPGKIWCGYRRLRLRGRRNHLLHRLVAEAFLPQPSWATEINHRDGNKDNNSVVNLEWSTRSLNLKHAYATGLQTAKRGEDNRSSKLTEKEVIEIKLALNMPYVGIGKRLGEKYGITPEAVSAIKCGKNWKHIDVS